MAGVGECDMSYRTILVHVDDSEQASERIKMAVNIALAEDAHLIGAATTGVSSALSPIGIVDSNGPDLAAVLEMLRARADRALAKFESAAHRVGLTSLEKRLIDDEAGRGISLQARYCDLVIVGQTDPNETVPVVAPDFPEYVVMHSAHPVLIVPYSGRVDEAGSKPLIAWDASMPAARAVTDAIPFLKQAAVVQLAVFSPEEHARVHGEQPGADIALYLARHDIRVNVTQQTANAAIGDALTTLASDFAADLIVMGGYGRARFHAKLLGGGTRTILESMTVPVMMSH
jgi:nucleotide-binding universal stress UspA family protein